MEAAIAFLDTSQAVTRSGAAPAGRRCCRASRARAYSADTDRLPFAVVEADGASTFVMVHCTTDGQPGPVMLTVTRDPRGGLQLADAMMGLLAKAEPTGSPGIRMLRIAAGVDAAMVALGIVAALKLS